MQCRWCRLCVRISSTHSPYLLSCAAACHPSPAAAPCAPALPRAPSSAFFVMSAISDATWRPLAFHCAMRITTPHGSSLVLLPGRPAAPGNIELEQCVGPHCVGQSRITTVPTLHPSPILSNWTRRHGEPSNSQAAAGPAPCSPFPSKGSALLRCAQHAPLPGIQHAVGGQQCT